jgi:predicted transcriptional regulator
MLRRPGGASMTEILAATSWQRTTARGRISDGVSKLLEKDEQIWSRKVDRERYYAIMKTVGNSEVEAKLIENG